MKKVILSVLLILGISACNDASQMYEDAKTKAVELKDSTVQQATEMGDSVSNYSDEMMNNVTNSIKLWIYETLEPTFAWMFLILFLLMFGALKMVIPFSNYAIVQLPIFLGSYGFIFSLFYQLKIASYALEATFWFLLPIVIVALGLFFSRKTLIPKIKEFNKKFNLEEEVAEEKVANTI